MIAVMGASGNVGGKVADRLIERGEQVRVFGRSAERLEPLEQQGAEVVVGDALNEDDLRRLFKDASSALVVLPDNVADPNYASNRSKMSQAITAALRETGVRHVVFASSLGADRGQGVGPVNTLHELEELLFGLEDTNVLSLRAALHMEQNLLSGIPMIKEQKMNGGAVKGDLALPLIACVDIAERAAELLASREFTGKSVETIIGPEDVSMEEATRAVGEALGIPDVSYVQFPPEGVKAALQGIGMSEKFASLLVEMQLAVNDGLLSDVQRTPGNTATTTVEEFLSSALK